jgi:hypothetical protein
MQQSAPKKDACPTIAGTAMRIQNLRPPLNGTATTLKCVATAMHVDLTYLNGEVTELAEATVKLPWKGPVL